ncbi:MAG: RagB/SusD family nutrient uptake outer membrane protein [Candidatus Cyclobacteriaceae bacterium M2_1C_046]
MRLQYILIIASVFFTMACTEEWLEVKRNKEQVVPQTLSNYRAILDNSTIMNTNYPYLGELSTDDFYIEHEWWLRAILVNQNAYLWKTEVYEGQDVFDWEKSYERIFYANTVLDGLSELENSSEKNELMGSAYFFRAWTYYKLVHLFCKPYISATASTTPGLPLRHEADINIPVTRSDLQATYDQIIVDLKLAAEFLPEKSLFMTQPNKAAAYGLLSKTYLHMNSYNEALDNVNKALEINSELVDFNDLDIDARHPLQDNHEIILYSQMIGIFPIADYPYVNINAELFNSYEDNDLRKQIYFRSDDGSRGFNGSYSGRFYFAGIATDELYLIRAECYARTDQKDLAMADLNYLLEHRYQDESFVPFTATTNEDALEQIIQERHKELIFRGIRWEDLRRLEMDVTLSRILDGQVYSLPPDDPRWVLPIPDKVIELSGIEQNER